MTSFILLQNVAYEGSSLKGVFSSFEQALDHLDTLDGYCMDKWTCDRDTMEPLNTWNVSRVANATAGWRINGPADLSFSIFACAITQSI